MPVSMKLVGGVLAVALAATSAAACSSGDEEVARCAAGADSVAREWNEEALDAIRRDEPAPTVHARNLYHLSAAMWDAWAAFGDEEQLFADVRSDASDVEAARTDAVIHAAAIVLWERYRKAVGGQESLASFEEAMKRLCGVSLGEAVELAEPGSAAGIGVEVGQAVLAAAIDDGANERGGYRDTDYQPVNPALPITSAGTNLIDPDRWQPLNLDVAVAQNGLPLEAGNQEFIGPHWGNVTSFALESSEDGLPIPVDAPPAFGTEEYVTGAVEVIELSNQLGVGVETIDISPAARGDNPLGTDDGTGHAVNPVTGEPYPPNVVDRGDYLRVIAEFWADGPDSETPPGHWNTLANDVSDDLDASGDLRIGGSGEEVNRLEWDIKLYLMLNAGMHDAAIAAWGAKKHFDYVRPISMIRYLGGLGQSTDPQAASYHPDGLPLIDGLIELVTEETVASGERHEPYRHLVGIVAVNAWRGAPDDPTSQVSGVGWIPAAVWMPYQRPTFVTPAFAAYVSGHSTFSRVGADLLTDFTGSPYFPGGIYEHMTPAGALLHEEGPSTDVVLQWATYADAADEAGRSRLPGGIHVPADDYVGRLMGAEVASAVWNRVLTLFS